jgi:ATP-dependent Clp protease ATP-binding subunit ClpA
VEKVIDEIYDPAYGARPLDRYLLDKIEPGLIDQVIQNEINK